MPKRASAPRRHAWNEIRRRAFAFVRKWSKAKREASDKQSFWNDFFAVFDVPRERVAIFEHPVKKPSGATGRIDLFWPGRLLVEHKSAGGDLAAALDQAFAYCHGLEDSVLPRHLLVSDFHRFRLRDLRAEDDADREHEFTLSELPEKVRLFGFMVGEEGPGPREQDPVDIRASKRISRIHDALAKRGYKKKDLGRYLVRLVFCLFGDDTEIFGEKGAFTRYIKERTGEDGRDLGQRLAEWFQVLDTPENKRPDDLDEDFENLPYVNGGLFAGPLRIPPFNKETRDLLLEACESDWSEISPAIFGALFQSVMDSEARRAEGAHYTSEESILRVIRPLFLDDLRREFGLLKRRRGADRKGRLESFRKRLARLAFLDPACGCGNFLVVAYRELRRLEMEVLEALRKEDEGLRLDVREPYLVRVTQFYGIEKEEFSARIAEASLWMMEHLMNREMSDIFNDAISRFPLEMEGLNIRADDALEMDWNDLLPAEQCDFVLGNPPYVGSNQRDATQRRQMKALKKRGLVGGGLDYVTAWFFTAGHYIRAGKGRIGFVATNSITQGRQVGELWPTLYDKCNLEIAFAHRPFAWETEVRSGMAHVHVVIIGLVKRADAPDSARLFSYDDPKGKPSKSQHASLTAYLTDGSTLSDSHIVVHGARNPMNGLPEMVKGNAPLDGGNYIFTEKEKQAFLREEPGAKKFMRPFLGSQEFLRGEHRWILALQKAKPAELLRLPKTMQRRDGVQKWRGGRSRESTLAKAKSPERYDGDVFPKDTFLVVPEVSSEHREYVPIGWLKPPRVPGNKLFVVEEADDALFALLTSAMHMAWLRYVGGRLESRYSYSKEVIYNTFPPPPGWEKKKARLEPHARAVLAARSETDSNLKDMYRVMPRGLRDAHTALDRAVDRMYRAKPFKTERERVEYLLPLYEKMAAPVVAEAAPNGSRRAAKSRRRPKKA